MNTFVTGATGFIGANLVRKLIDQDIIVHVLCRDTADISHLPLHNIKIFRGDLQNIELINEAMHECDHVYHLAAYAKNWARDYSVFQKPNVLGLQNILDASIRNNVKKIVFTSSVVTFGPSNGVAVNEYTKRKSDFYTDYERSKVEAHQIVQKYLDKGIDIVSVHPTRVFGPGLLSEGNSVTKMIELYLHGKWRTYPGDGNAIGNYSFVDDVAHGHILAMHHGKKGEQYILGGENVSYKEFFLCVSEIIDHRHYIFPVPKPIALAYSRIEQKRAEWFHHYPVITPGWVKVFCDNWECSSEKAEREIGYTITPLMEALQRTIYWLHQQKELHEVPS